MVLYEYTDFSTGTLEKILQVKLTEERIIDKINEYASQGWELFWIDKTPRLTFGFVFGQYHAHSERTFYFRRIKNDHRLPTWIL